MSPALAGGFLTTAPPRKPSFLFLNIYFFFFFFFFFWLRQVLVAAGRIFVVTRNPLLWCLGSSLQHVGFSVVVVHGLQSVWAVLLWPTCSVVVALGLSFPVACGILVPRPGIEPTYPALEGGLLTPGPPGKSQFLYFFLNLFLFLFDLFLALLGLRCCMRAFSSCSERGLVTLRCGARASHCSGFSCCGPRVLGHRLQ